VIRGPLGVGKTEVATRVSRRLRAEYVSIDQILDERGLWDSGRLTEFLRANDFAVQRARPILASGRPVVFDGNFYWKTQIADLVARLPARAYVFTLRAPVGVCIERDAGRPLSHGADATRAVFAKTRRVAWGVEVGATGPLASVVQSVVAYLWPGTRTRGVGAEGRRGTRIGEP
jgi:predicted kinase